MAHAKKLVDDIEGSQSATESALKSAHEELEELGRRHTLLEEEYWSAKVGRRVGSWVGSRVGSCRFRVLQVGCLTVGLKAAYTLSKPSPCAQPSPLWI